MPFGRMRLHDARHMGSEDARAKSGRGERTQACRAHTATRQPVRRAVRR
jgi:hypothetical protein